MVMRKPKPPPSRERSKISKPLKPTPSKNITQSKSEPTLRVICSPRVKPATHLSRVVASILLGRPCNNPLPFEGVYADKLGLDTFKNTLHGDKEFKDYTNKKYGRLFRKRELFVNKKPKPATVAVSECEIDPCNWIGTSCKKDRVPSVKAIGPSSSTLGKYGSLAYGMLNAHHIHRQEGDRNWSAFKKTLHVDKEVNDFTERMYSGIYGGNERVSVKSAKTLKEVTAFPSEEKLKIDEHYSVFRLEKVSLDVASDEVPVPAHRAKKQPHPYHKPVKAKGGEEKVLGLGFVPREETKEVTVSSHVVNVKPEQMQKNETKINVTALEDNRQLQKSASKVIIEPRVVGGGGKAVVESKVESGWGGGEAAKGGDGGERVVERVVERVAVDGRTRDGGGVGERVGPVTPVGERVRDGGERVGPVGVRREVGRARVVNGGVVVKQRDIKERSVGGRVAEPHHASGKPAGYPRIKGQTKSYTDIKHERPIHTARLRSASADAIPKQRQFEKKQIQSRGTFSHHYGHGIKSHRKLPLKKKYERKLKLTGLRKRNEWAGEDCEVDDKRSQQINRGGGDDDFCYQESQELLIINQCWEMASKMLKGPSKTQVLSPADNLMLYLEQKFPKSKWGRGTPIATRNYPNGSVFVAQYQNGGSRVYYPHGGLAVAISGPSPSTSQILLVRDPTDQVVTFDKALLADLNSSGKGMIFGDDGLTKAQYSPIGGLKFDNEKGHRWQWNQGGQRIIMKLNNFMSLRMSDLDKIFLNFHGNTRGFLVNVATGMEVTLMSRPDPLLESRSPIRPKTSDKFDYVKGRFLPRPTLGFVDKFRCQSRDLCDAVENQPISFNNVKKPRVSRLLPDE